MNYKVVAIDDEFLSLRVMQKFCADHPRIDSCEVFQSVALLKEYLAGNTVHILISDIEMPDHNGLKLAAELSCAYEVILSTAYAQFALEGFAINAADYILKPYSQERFNQAIDKAVTLLDLKSKAPDSSFIVVQTNYAKRRLEQSEIVLVESIDDYVKFTLVSGETVSSRKTLKSVLDELPGSEFVRVHRSFIVSRKFIRAIRKNKLEVGSISVPIGYTYRNVLTDWL